MIHWQGNAVVNMSPAEHGLLRMHTGGVNTTVRLHGVNASLTCKLCMYSS